MPYLRITSNVALSEAEKNNALKTLSQAAAELLGKSETYVMTSWHYAKMTMGGSDAPAAFIDFQSIRLPAEDTSRISKEICERLSLTVDIRQDRIYINFGDISPSLWGWNGKTFGD